MALLHIKVVKKSVAQQNSNDNSRNCTIFASPSEPTGCSVEIDD